MSTSATSRRKGRSANGKDKPDHRFLLTVALQNLLSFGPDTPQLALENLNILIGPNSSGKSNLIEALALMRATPVPPQLASSVDLRGVIRRGGGVSEWIWKGNPQDSASVGLAVAGPNERQGVMHFFRFGNNNQEFRLLEEWVGDPEHAMSVRNEEFYYRFHDGQSTIGGANGKRRKLSPDHVSKDASILAQRRDPERYPEITFLAESYEQIRIYREWSFGRNTIFRQPQRADMRSDRLAEDFSNLGLFLSQLRNVPRVKKAIVEGLADLYDGFTDFEISVKGGSVEIFFHEGDYSIPAARLSDGALRYLCLLAILCDPTPPPLICIEEPELGLHPDLLHKIADLLITASERTQLIVTTHSDTIVNVMTRRPEVVVVCEKQDGKTQMNRLSGKKLKVWLGDYELGQLWTKGFIGGNRW